MLIIAARTAVIACRWPRVSSCAFTALPSPLSFSYTLTLHSQVAGSLAALPTDLAAGDLAAAAGHWGLPASSSNHRQDGSDLGLGGVDNSASGGGDGGGGSGDGEWSDWDDTQHGDDYLGEQHGERIGDTQHDASLHDASQQHDADQHDATQDETAQDDGSQDDAFLDALADWEDALDSAAQREPPPPPSQPPPSLPSQPPPPQAALEADTATPETAPALPPLPPPPPPPTARQLFKGD